MKKHWEEATQMVVSEIAKNIDHVEGKYRCIMDIAKTLSMEEIQVLEKMLLDLWCDKYQELCKENKNENI